MPLLLATSCFQLPPPANPLFPGAKRGATCVSLLSWYTASPLPGLVHTSSWPHTEIRHLADLGAAGGPRDAARKSIVACQPLPQLWTNSEDLNGGPGGRWQHGEAPQWLERQMKAAAKDGSPVVLVSMPLEPGPPLAKDCVVADRAPVSPH